MKSKICTGFKSWFKDYPAETVSAILIFIAIVISLIDGRWDLTLAYSIALVFLIMLVVQNKVVKLQMALILRYQEENDTLLRENHALNVWHDVKEELPNDMRDVLIKSGSCYYIAYYIGRDNDWMDPHTERIYKHVTHWMELPLNLNTKNNEGH